MHDLDWVDAIPSTSATGGTSGGNGALPTRDQIDARYKWRLEDLFASDHLWENEFNELKERLPQVEELRGKLGESPGTFYRVLQTRDAIEERLGRLYVYAAMRSDEDTTNEHYQAVRERAARLATEVQAALSFIAPEILDIPEATLEGWLQANEQLRLYEHHLRDLLRSRRHVLSQEQEELLARAAEVARSPSDTFNMFNNADLKFPSIVDENGVEVEVTKGRYLRFQESRDRRVRRDAFEALYGEYARWPNTLASILAGSIRKDIFYARARNHPSSRRMALHADNVPDEVYDNLIDTVHQNLAPLHRAVALRKRALGLEAVHPYDLHVPLVPDVRWTIPYEQAKELLPSALEKVGGAYSDLVRTALSGAWIDVKENRGKRSGAYSWGAYGSHPYILLNYEDRLSDAFTLAHEVGHAIHSHLSWSTQPYVYGNYSIFVAEVASTVNETLFTRYLLEHERDAGRRAYLLNHWVDQIRGTVYNQVLFAEFEQIVHSVAEAGQALTAERLNAIARELYLKYLGPDFVLDSPFEMNWARIPHFYNSYYVYKYATGYAAATAIVEKVVAGEPGAVQRYLDFLRSGSSDYPLHLLKRAGVDMTSPEPVEAVAGLLDRLVSEMESLLLGSSANGPEAQRSGGGMGVGTFLPHRPRG